MKYRLRMEGVNILRFVADCKNLSVIRGGGLIILDAPDLLSKAGVLSGMTEVTKGASMAIYDFEARDDEAANGVRDRVFDQLNKSGELRHATFVVDVVPKTGDFGLDREKLIALNRFRQMRSPSVAYRQTESAESCGLDGVRPAEEEVDLKPPKSLSKATVVRRRYGIQQRQAIFKRVNEDQQTPIQLPRFTDDLESLSSDSSKGNLHKKVAVIHIDGNGFGSIQAAKCRDEAKQSQFDKLVQGGRLGWLREHLRTTIEEKDWLNGKEYRMEILVWGGDEVVAVVPAWQGWALLSSYFRHSASWAVFQGEKLTHAAGMVFCHHNAPIHTVTALTRNLMEREAKAVSKTALNENRNVFVYQVLESFDTLGSEIEQQRMRLCPGTEAEKAARRPLLCLKGADMDQIRDDLNTVRDSVPRHKLHELLAIWGTGVMAAEVEKTLEKDPVKRHRTKWQGLKQKLGGAPMCWLHLQELWDFVG